ncbi:MAG: hypothetical protein LUC37_05845 [Prevotella sp.]|nr:hypothetical protein [Prevotella sp.]
METKKIEQAEDELRAEHPNFDPNPYWMCYRFKDAKEGMMEILHHLLGKKAKWNKDYDEVATWLTDSHFKGLLIMGEYGTGKSLICCKVIPLLMKVKTSRGPSIMLSAFDLNRYAEVLGKGHHKIIIIDDVGVESELVEYGKRSIVFNEVVDRAERLGQTLILTTNLSEKELTSKYGNRTIDRLKFLTRKVIFSGESLRVPKPTEKENREEEM